MFHIFAGFLLGFLPALLTQAAPGKSSGVWLDVPYVKQTEDGCGSAAIAMLLQYWSAWHAGHGQPGCGSDSETALFAKGTGYLRIGHGTVFSRSGLS